MRAIASAAPEPDKLPFSGISLRKLETELANHQPFGDGDYITSRLRVHYEQRLFRLARYDADAKRLSELLSDATTDHGDAVLSDPILRHVINASVCHHVLRTPAPEKWTRAVLQEAIQQLQDGVHLPLLCAHADAIPPVRVKQHEMWIWQPPVEDNEFSERFKIMAHDNFHLQLARHNIHNTVSAVSRAIRLLQILLPILSASALRHVRLIVFAELPAYFSSATSPIIQATIFLHRRFIDATASLAEHLLHEAMHQKFIDLVQTHSMLRKGYTSQPC